MLYFDHFWCFWLYFDSFCCIWLLLNAWNVLWTNLKSRLYMNTFTCIWVLFNFIFNLLLYLSTSEYIKCIVDQFSIKVVFEYIYLYFNTFCCIWLFLTDYFWICIVPQGYDNGQLRFDHFKCPVLLSRFFCENGKMH